MKNNKIFKKFAATFLAVAILLASAPLNGLTGLDFLDLFNISASAAEYSGTCGENLTWTFDEATGELRIEGTGAMDDYADAAEAPWCPYEVKKILIENGVTTIGTFAFHYAEYVTDVVISDSVVSIGDHAFHGCAFKNISIGNEVTTIGQGAFADISVSSIVLPDSVTKIGLGAFRYSGFNSFTFGRGIRTIAFNAFDECYIRDVYFYGTEKQWESIKEEQSERSGLNSTNIHFVSAESQFGGSCGETLTWSVNAETGMLAIRGTGKMYNYNNYSQFPWFKHASLIKFVKISRGVEFIDEMAFHGYAEIESITVDVENTTYSSDEYGVLFNKDKTKLIRYPTGNKRISYTIPNSVTSIGNDAFNSCKSLTNVAIPVSVTSIGKTAFYGCLSLKNAVIPVGVTSIGDYSFYGCSSLTNITIPDGVTSIGAYTFSKCAELTSLVLPISVTEVCKDAFYNCPIKCIDYGGSMLEWTKITKDTGNECLNTAEISFAAVENISGTWEDNLTWFLCDETDELVIKGSGNMKNCSRNVERPWHKYARFIKTVTIENGVTSIGSYAFDICTNLTSITIPDGVTNIGFSAFGDCTNLTSIKIPDSVTSIGGWAFYDCDSLTNITVPDNVTSISSYTFYNCDSLTSVTIPDSVTEIGRAAFGDCLALKEIIIPDSVTSIDTWAFSDCYKLETVIIGDGVTSIASCAFSGCTSLVNLRLGENIKRFEESVFAGCSKLKSVTLPDSVEYVSAFMFDRCTSLEYVTFGKNTKTIAIGAFCDCENLRGFIVPTENPFLVCENNVLFSKDMKELRCYPMGLSETTYTVPEGVEYIRDTAFYNSKLRNVTLPDSLVFLGQEAFGDCRFLEEINIPVGVTDIQLQAFKGCDSLTEIAIPDSVQYLGEDVFIGCDSLTEVCLGENLGKIPDGTFFSCKSLKSIIIPENIKIIGANAFAYCLNLESIVIHNSVESIKYNAFYNCSNLTKAYYVGNQEEWDNVLVEINNDDLLDAIIVHTHKFNAILTKHPTCSEEGYEIKFCNCGCSHIYDLPKSEDHTWSEWTVTTEPTTENEGSKTRTCSVCSEEETESIPKLEEETVVNGTCGEKVIWTLNKETGELILEGSGEMTEYSYSYETSSTDAPWYEYRLLIKTVTIGDGITNAGEYSFYNCKNLTSVKLGDSVSKIGVSTFLAGDKYESITVDDNNKTYSDKDGVLYSKDMTKLIHYPCGKKNESYIFPEGITYIEKYALRDCHYLKSATLPQSLTSINDRAFYFNKSIETVTIPDSVTSIGERAFSGCYNLINITIPDTVTTIGRYAFNDTKYYKDVSKWENDVLYIGNYLIEAKNSLSGRYEIKDGTKCIADYAFINCSNLTDVTIPDSVTSIGQRAFYGCAELEKVVIPDGITNIRDFTFKNCNNITTIIIPDSVVSIDEAAFYGCSGIVDVYYNGTEEEWGKIEVKSGNSDLLNATIHFAESEHEHSYESEITTQPTCTAEGVETFTCECGDSYTQTVPEKGHTLSHITVESTCKVAGMEYDLCSECEGVFNSNKLALKDHTWGEWTVTAKPTTENEGSKTRTCSVCSKEETESIPKLEVIRDEATGIEIVFGEEYGDGVEVQASEIYDGNSFQLVEANYGNVKTTIFDISTTVDGVKVQPTGKVKVRIPLPEGFGTGKVVVCYVDSENGKVTSIPAKVVDGYVEFETDHFSHYALLATKGKVHSVKIDDVSLYYKDTMFIFPKINADDGVKYTVEYSSSKPSVAEINRNGQITAKGFGRTTITCTVTDEYGNTVTDTFKVNVKYTFLQWIIKLFLFGDLWYY